MYLSRWRIGRSDVANDGWKVFGPKCAFSLSVVPQCGRILRGIDSQVFENLALFGHVPMHSQNILWCRISAAKITITVNDENFQVPIYLAH